MGRLPVVVAVTLACLALVLLQGRYLDGHMRIKVEASDLLPSGHPKNTEFNFIRETFKGSSRGFFVAVEAPVARLRDTVPRIATRFSAGLPQVDFVRYRIERPYFEEHLLLFQTLDNLRRQAGYLKEYRGDVARLMERAGSLSDLENAISDIVDGEQDLSTPTDEAAKDKKLATDVASLRPFLVMVQRSLEQEGAGQAVDPHYVDRGVEELLLRGWFDARDLSRLDRELMLPENVWERPGPTIAIIWISTLKSDFDAEFAGDFMRKAEALRKELALAYPDVTLRFTGGIASYNTYQKTVLADFEKANVWGLVSVLLLLVIGFRAITPFLLLMLFLTSGTMGTLVMQNFLFDGVNMIATAAALAVIGIGSDY
ncbi:MAG TPA: hypothetical protein VN923_06545, partial [Thermoanaerobaculia bacterium]|nr:hypothetical protein [Thermoanaerobaculia bacterium]